MQDEIFSVLLEWNPWLEGEIPAALLGIPREYDIVSYVAVPEIKILEGVRRSGKSTLLYQIVKHAKTNGKNVLYINFDDEILARYSLADVYYAFTQRMPVDYLLIDEIQHCKDWVPFVRKFYDRKTLEQIWITGSNASLIKKEYADLLTGRNLKLSISPLSFREFLHFKGMGNISLPTSRKNEGNLKNLFNDYLNFGAFPAIALRTVYQRELLINYFDDFIYKDIATRYEVNISKIKDLAIYLTTNSANLFSYRKIAKILNLHPNTVNDYVSYMKEIFLFDEIYKFDYSLKNQYSNDKKIYIIDTGLANAVSFKFSEDKGRMLETLVYRQLKRLGNEIFFHRGKKECDFIVKNGLNITQAIQVTCSLSDPKTKERELAGLLDAMQTYGLKEAIIYTLDETDDFSIEVEGREYRIRVQPTWKWLLTN